MNSFPKQEVLDVCAQYGPRLRVPAGLDARRVMAAIAQVESGLGGNCGPRHEPAYDTGGKVWNQSPAQRQLVARWKSDGASSFGPWQMMLPNCQGHTPAEMRSDLDVCALLFVSQFNLYVIGLRNAQTLAEIGEVWNMGHIAPDPEYVAKLQAAYDGLAVGDGEQHVASEVL